MPTTPASGIHAANMAATNSPVIPVAAAAPAPRHARALSMSSDRPSTTVSQTLMCPPLSVSPEAVFIAGSAASQIVTNDHDGHSETWYDQVGIEPSGETALVSPGALQLANNFIDQLLFNILGVARSTSLSALRPAVSEVLKPKLAKDATNQADEELREYLGGGEVDDLVQSPDTQSPRDWDLELVWKRTRLRCMVYSSLGDMEEEDEDYFMEQEHLNGVSGTLGAETVSPAVAIFLTSILEFMGEQVLVISGQAAFNRMRTKYEKELREGSRAVGDIAERVVVEELDMERVALDRTLGRLWRSWKKRIRSPVESGHQRSIPSRIGSHSRHGSIVATDTPAMVPPSTETIHEPEEAVVPAPVPVPTPAHEAAKETKEERNPATVPLPMSNHDVAEIEVPGLVSYSDEEDSDLEEEEDVAAVLFRARPKSLVLFSSRNKHTGTAADAPVKRTNSLPSTAGTRRKLRQRAMAADVSAQGAKEQGAEPSKSKDAAAKSITGSGDAAKTQAVPPAGESAESLAGSETKEESQDGPVAKIVAEASAIGTAALAGVAALAQGTTPQTTVTPEGEEAEEEGEEEEEEVDEFTEEPEILTSSRVSMCGRSSPSTSESGAAVGRPPSILVGRSNSLRSVRMIDVQPRSPSVRSAHATVDFDYAAAARSANYSREGSVSTPPIVEEGDSEEKLVKGSIRSSSMKSSREASRERMMAPSPSFRSSSPSNVLAPTSAPAVGPTKVSILNTAAAPDAESRIDPPPRMPSYGRQPTLPTLPERSANRPTHGKSSSYTAAQSVERPSAAARGSPESPKRARPAASESPSSTSSTRFKAVPSTEDSGANRAQDVARNFEELLQNDQTLQYTLTPENMREMEVSIPPTVAMASLTGEQASGRGDSGTGSGTRTLERSRSSSLKRSLSVTKTTGLHSNPPEPHTNARPSGPVPRAPPVSMTTQARSGPGPQARDARVPRESIQDFADFIRSTGPSGNGPPNRTGTMPAHRRDISQPVPPTTRRPSIGPKRTVSTRARLQARDAAVSSNNESSDLIDFIRRGPPSNPGINPRIPRNVAPFRTTMDSDQLQMTGASGGKAVDATIPDVQAGRVSTTVTENSIQSSINSSTALLNKANKPAQYTNNFDEEDMVPKRKQRRVRDPYAIDFSDEDDDDLLEELDIAPKPKPKPRQEESLIDFLNNCEPPPEPSPPQPFVNTQQTQPKKKQSAPNLLQRLRGAGGGSSSDRSGSTKAGDESRSSNSPKAGTPGHGGGGGRGYTPIVANVPPNAGNMPSNMTSTGSPRAPPVSGRVPMKSYEPRDPAMSVNTKTSDLAKFLRESEPPPSTLASPSPPEEKATGFARIFERRKKSTAY